MKTKQITRSVAALALLLVFSFQSSPLLNAATTITDTNHFAYGANVGWLECRGDVANGAVIGEYVCSGYIWAANVGWISLGNGSPANGIRYQNNSASDWGVNHDGLGNLRGYAWGANIGWVNFEDTGAPKVDLWTGRLSGYAWSANCGWISLSNAQAVVQTAYLAPGTDSDGDSIADGWELTYTNTLSTFTASSDTDRDGMTDKQEYLADTNPLDVNDSLRITTYHHYGTYNLLVWTGKPTRFYRVEQALAIHNVSLWETLTLGFEDVPGWNYVGFDAFETNAFYRIRVVQPLSP